jgi:hypothetical protein
MIRETAARDFLRFFFNFFSLYLRNGKDYREAAASALSNFFLLAKIANQITKNHIYSIM